MIVVGKEHLCEPKVYRLYQLTPREHIKIHYGDLVMEFHHIDGMYSYNVITEGRSKGKVFHLSANTPLTRITAKEYEVPVQ